MLAALVNPGNGHSARGEPETVKGRKQKADVQENAGRPCLAIRSSTSSELSRVFHDERP